ncbi:MAG: DUF1761 domain-containing protein [Saprospiraceae bacterium]
MKRQSISILLAALAAFVVSGVWYTLFSGLWLELRGLDPADAANQTMSAGTMILELARTLVLAAVLSWFVSKLGITDWRNALTFNLVIWLGFPLVLLTGSVIHEGVHWKIAAIHAGDWFVKPLVMLLILSFRNRKKQ